MKRNLVIRASAGTGKTYSLATRFIRLMLVGKVPAERIVALTFSRAAAQEIYLKLLNRLWTAARDEAGARKEAAELGEEKLGRADFAKALKAVIASQHHGTIATLDSFLLRIVRSFPLESGFQNAVDVLDGFGEERALSDARSAILDSADAPDEFRRNFRLATGGEYVRACDSALSKALAGWREVALNRPESAAWTAESMRSALGVSAFPEKPDATGLAASGNNAGVFDKFVEGVESFAGAGEIFAKTKAGEMAKYFLVHPESTTFAYDTAGSASRKGQHKECVLDAKGVQYVLAALKYMRDLKWGREIERTAAKLALARMIELKYDESTRRRGLLTFSDLSRSDGESFALENAYFRFDSRFDHWALDEFQDTSEAQWASLKRLVEEAASPDAGERSVMAVGDLKQSIYTWRGGNEAPFKELMSRATADSENWEILDHSTSYRYGASTADFVNRVFGRANLERFATEARRPAIERWLAEDCWMEHHARKTATKDYVCLVAVPAASPNSEEEIADSGGAAMRVLAPRIRELAKRLWADHEKVGSVESIGILVRDNTDGAALAEQLRAEGLPVVWEGVDGILDSAVVRAVIELLRLAEHPEDTFAWKTVDELLPLRKIVFPTLAKPSTVSQKVAEMLSRSGLARTLGNIARALGESATPPDERTRIELAALVRAAVAYERSASATSAIKDFVAYLQSSAGRETTASPKVLRILTIHRAKGLTLDHVIVPILSTARGEAIDSPHRGAVLFGEGWALNAPSADEAALNARVLAERNRALCERMLDELRVSYVAMTRARKSTYVFFLDEPHGEKFQLRDLVAAPFADFPAREEAYGQVVGEVGTPPGFAEPKAPPKADEISEWKHTGASRTVARRTPATLVATYGRNWKARKASYFEPSALSAAEKGTEAHAEYAKIEWANDRKWEAFVKPSADARVWRERDYELFENGVWESGRFDRVVITGSGAERRATIYDFKTNAKGAEESAEEFRTRIKETYLKQMEAYRHALSALTGIPPEMIAVKLLLEATGEMV